MNFLKKTSSRVVTIASSLLLAVSVSAQAALPAGVGTFFTNLSADWTDLLDTYLYPFMFLVVGGLIILKLVKMGAKKASS